jgi:uncharacterized delta-60 repeat protein
MRVVPHDKTEPLINYRGVGMLNLKSACLGILVAACSAMAGVLDPSFNPGSGAGGGLVEQVLPLSNGKILVCGNFTSFNGRNKAYIARLNSDGSVDESFTGSPGYWVRNMAVQGDGKIVIGGYFTTVQGVSRNLIARLNADGSLDTSFNPGSGATDIIAGGIDGNVTPFVFWVAVQGDGKILATGNFRNYNGSSSVGIVRINPDGSRDTSFNVGGGLDSWGRHITLMGNGQILVSGWFTQYNGRSFNRIARINADGSPDGSFNPFFGDKTAIYCTVVQPDGKIIATGHSLNEQGLFHREMARLNSDGTFDEAFVGSTNEKTESAVRQSDGKIIVGGNFSQANNAARSKIARFNPDGTLDSFSADIDNFVWSTALQSDGKLLIAGGFYTVDGVSRGGVARLLTGASGGETDVGPVLSVTGVAQNSITLNWTDSSTSRSSYEVQQKASNGSFTTIVTLGAGSRSYTVNGLSPGTTYMFRLRANNNTGAVFFSNEVTGTTSGATGSSNRATFVATDTGTHGTWKGVYGSQGYLVFGDATAMPSFATISTTGKSDWIWNWSTQDAAALQRANGTDRLAACWYSASEFSINFRFSDTALHRVALYFLDWDLAGRNQNVRVYDGSTGALLDSRTLSNFGQGIYLQWDLAGSVRVAITPNNVNGVCSGIFFGGGGTVATASTPIISPNGGSYSSAQSVTLSSATSGAQIRYTLNGTDPTQTSALYSGPITISSSATLKARAFATGMNPSAVASATFTIGTSTGGSTAATFITKDTTTRGSWIGTYGGQGYWINGKGSSYPSYVQPSFSNSDFWIWSDNTTDARALQAPGGAGRIASCAYKDGSFDLNLNFMDGATHRVALYFCDWDNSGRSQTVQVINASTGAVLNSQSLSAFSQGQYLVYDLKGNIRLRFTKVSGFNSVLNGLFF